MSQRFLIPTNLFYHWQDPLPENGFPEPNTGDIYFNVSSQVIRVFYEGGWHDAGSGSGSSHEHPEYLTTEQADEQYVRASSIVVSPSPPSGVPIGGHGTVWFQY